MAVLKGIGCVAAIKKRLCTWAAYLMLAVQGITILACAEEILLATQQPFVLEGGTTLVIEDVDPRQGKIWLDIFDKNASHESAVLALGESLSGRGVNLTVTGIYAGGEVDLVALDLEAKGPTKGGGGPITLESEDHQYDGNNAKKSPDFLVALTLIILAGYCLARSP
jgi:hypothetical protein